MRRSLHQVNEPDGPIRISLAEILKLHIKIVFCCLGFMAAQTGGMTSVTTCEYL